MKGSVARHLSEIMRCISWFQTTNRIESLLKNIHSKDNLIYFRYIILPCLTQCSGFCKRSDHFKVTHIPIVAILGPATWAKLPNVTIGKRQSPIDIVQAKASFDENLKTLKFSYPSFAKATLQNNGATVLFSPSAEGNNSGNKLYWSHPPPSSLFPSPPLNPSSFPLFSPPPLCPSSPPPSSPPPLLSPSSLPLFSPPLLSPSSLPLFSPPLLSPSSLPLFSPPLLSPSSLPLFSSPLLSPSSLPPVNTSHFHPPRHLKALSRSSIPSFLVVSLLAQLLVSLPAFSCSHPPPF